MSSLEYAIDAAAKAWWERSEASIQKAAQKAVEQGEAGRVYWDDPEHFEEYYSEAHEDLARGPISWQDCSEEDKNYARNQVRQPILDALPAFFDFEAHRITELAHAGGPDGVYVLIGYLEGASEVVANERG